MDKNLGTARRRKHCWGDSQNHGFHLFCNGSRSNTALSCAGGGCAGRGLCRNAVDKNHGNVTECFNKKVVKTKSDSGSAAQVRNFTSGNNKKVIGKVPAHLLYFRIPISHFPEFFS